MSHETELKRLLEEIGETWVMPVAVATQKAFGQVKSFYAPEILRSAEQQGYIEAADDAGPLVYPDKIYGRDVRLTDAGLKFVGLERMPADEPKKLAKTLFD